MSKTSQHPATKADLNNVKCGLEALINDGQKQILKTLSDHSKTLANHSRVLSDHGKTLADHSEQLKFIYEHGATKDELKKLATKKELNEVKDVVKQLVNKSLDHDDKLAWLKENMLTKKEFFNGQDKMMTILERLDKERIFTNKNVDTHEEKIEENRIKIKKHTTDIKKIKGVLKLAHS